jgi:hypothetical protein
MLTKDAGESFDSLIGFSDCGVDISSTIQHTIAEGRGGRSRTGMMRKI